VEQQTEAINLSEAQFASFGHHFPQFWLRKVLLQLWSPWSVPCSGMINYYVRSVLWLRKHYSKFHACTRLWRTIFTLITIKSYN